MPGAASLIDGGKPSGGAAPSSSGCGTRRTALPAPPLGRLALGFGLLFVFVEPLTAAVLQPGADFRLDGLVAGEPQRLDLHQSVRLACRDDEHLARGLRLVGPLQRKLTLTC